MNRKYTEKLLRRIREDYYSRMDEKGSWKTTEDGDHIHFNEQGEIDKGNPHVVAAMTKNGNTKTASSMKNAVETARKNMEERKNKALSNATSGSSVGPNVGAKSERFRAEKGKEVPERNLQYDSDSNKGKSYEERLSLMAQKDPGAGYKNEFAKDNTGFLKKEDAEKVGGVTSGANGDFTAKSGTSRMIDTTDALKEIKKDGKPNSLMMYMDEDGNLSPERQKVHDEIVKQIFADKLPADGKPTMIMSGGGPASGKSFVSKNAEEKYNPNRVVKIDPDELKAMLPEYAEMGENFYKSGEKTQNNAAYFHEESSALAKRVYQYGLENGINVVYDGTGDGSVDSVMSKIRKARENGYEVSGEYVTVNTEDAVKRNQQRYENGCKKYEAALATGKRDERGRPLDENGKPVDAPRRPPEDMARNTHAKVTDISAQVAGEYDHYTLTDNNGTVGERKVIATCDRGGKLTAVKGEEKKVQAFLDKGKEGYTLDEDGVVTKLK